MSSQSDNYRPSEILNISADQAGQRIDNFLLTYLKGIPKTRIYKMLRKGEVRVNKGRIKPVYKLKSGDAVRLPPLFVEERPQQVNASLDKVKQLEERIIYESKRLIILNKPAGMAVHGGSGDSFGVIEALRSLRSDLHYLELVHRLDKLTSGCLMIAKKRSTLRYLHEQLRTRQLNKTYEAIVWGNWPKEDKQINEPLKTVRLKNGDRRAVVAEDGKASRTQFQLLKYVDGGFSHILAKPVTGRMHQIRVHCAWNGHPICGDKKYLTDQELLNKHDRLFLHARAISFKESADDSTQEISCVSRSFNSILTS